MIGKKLSVIGKQLSVIGALVLAASLTAQAQLDLHGFADSRIGTRIDDADDRSLTELRLQLEREIFTDRVTFQLRGDLIYDDIVDDHDIDLETGDGWLDLREVNAQFSPADIVDVKVGRQIITWGTGDLVFINDLFPKDWVSFFTGRDEEYLKAPSDALMVSVFPGGMNVDLVYVPRFDADRHLTGDRISFFQPLGPSVIQTDRPDDLFTNDEWAFRISENIGGTEVALYAYDGYWKSPAGQRLGSGRATFPALRVFGLSARSTIGSGIAHFEFGHYDSREDDAGNKPNIRNSETRLLGGYEREIARELTLGLQTYTEIMSDHDKYLDTLPDGLPAADEVRQVLTARLTQQLMDQNLTVSLVGFWSPTDRDGYLRPNVAYKINDAWLLTAGGNVFFGDDDHTFFGQFEDNNNLYAGARYSF